MQDLGQDISSFAEEEMPDPNTSFFKLDFDNFSLDLLPSVKAAIKFSEADLRKETVEVDGIHIHFMGYRDLIEDKSSAGRQKDLEDIDHLNRLRKTD